MVANTKQNRKEKREVQKALLTRTEKELNSKGRFWCYRKEQWTRQEVCIHRQDRLENGCVSCKQGSVVKQFKREG